MDHIVDIRILSEHLIQRSLICDVHSIERRLSPAQELDTADNLLAGGVVAIINNDDLIARLNERESGKGANVARATINALAHTPP